MNRTRHGFSAESCRRLWLEGSVAMMKLPTGISRRCSPGDAGRVVSVATSTSRASTKVRLTSFAEASGVEGPELMKSGATRPELIDVGDPVRHNRRPAA